MQNTPFSTNKTLNINGRLVDLTHPRIMGILNVTTDSFYDGGLYTSETAILRQAEKMISEGADFIDVGGYSTRPGAAEISAAEEMKRVVDTISLILRQFPTAILSVDTFRSEVAKAAIDAGASIINDVSSGELDPDMPELAGRMRVPYIAMHMRGTPRTMQSLTQYDNLVPDIIGYFHRKVYELQQSGVRDVIIDPGFGFSKTAEQNFELLEHLDRFSILGKPLLVGLSRKSMIWRTLNIDPESALNGTTALHSVALLKGADILRVHDVREASEVIKLFRSLRVHATA